MTSTHYGEAELGGVPTGGQTVGILCLQTSHPLLPGNVQHARSYRFPVLYEPLELDDPWRLLNGDESLTGPITAAAMRLERRGVRAVVGACGSFAYFQPAVAAALRVPVALSPMLMVPSLLSMLPLHQSLGVLCGALSSMNERVFAACSIPGSERLAFAPLVGGPGFDGMLKGETQLDMRLLQQEVLTAARALVIDRPDVGAILLQCSDLPPYAAEIQAATLRPVFDMTMFIEWIAGAVERQPYGMRPLTFGSSQ